MKKSESTAEALLKILYTDSDMLRSYGNIGRRVEAARYVKNHGARVEKAGRDAVYPLFETGMHDMVSGKTEIKTPVATLTGKKTTEIFLDVNGYFLKGGMRMPRHVTQLAKQKAFQPVKLTPVVDEEVKKHLQRTYPQMKKGQPEWQTVYDSLVYDKSEIEIHAESYSKEAETHDRLKILMDAIHDIRKQAETELSNLKTKRQTSILDQEYAGRLNKRILLLAETEGKLSIYLKQFSESL